MEQAASSQKPLSWLNLVLAIGPVVLSVGLAYGATMLAQGEQRNKISTLEKQAEQMVTRDELKLYIDLTRDDLREIKENMRALRSDLGRTRR